MKHILSNPFHELLRFDLGEEVVEGIKKFAKDKKIDSAWVMGLGSAKEIELGFYELNKKEFKRQVFNEITEVNDMVGNIAEMHGEVIVHVHGSFCKNDFSVVGGHIFKLVTNATMEVFLHKIDDPMERAYNSEIGLNLLEREEKRKFI